MSKPRTGIPSDQSTSPPFSTARSGAPTASDYSKPNPSALRSVVNEAAHGEAQATSRYGGTTKVHPGPENYNANKPQRLGDSTNLQDSGYNNDVPESSYLRGGPKESAQGKPNFDPRGKDGLPKKW